MRGIMAVILGCGCVAANGCNTDPIWEPHQSAEAPTTRIDRPQGIDLPDIRIADAREVDLVEQMMEYRALYHRTLKGLHAYYRERGYESKRVWAAQELSQVKRITPFRYILSGEIPSDTLVPRDSIPEADALFQRGRTLMEEGGHSLPALYRRNKMREALAVFRELIEQFPASDKIDDAAFFSGEIHKEYFKGHERLAVRWYERAFIWDSATPYPARFQAAAVYDLRLHDRDRALELYRAVLDREASNRSNVSFAVRRIDQLTRDPGDLAIPTDAPVATFAPVDEDQPR